MVLLEIVYFDQWVVIVASIVFTIILISFWSSVTALKKKISDKEVRSARQEGLLREKDLTTANTIHEKDLQIEKMLATTKDTAKTMAEKQLADWKEKELEAHRQVIIKAAFEQSKVWLAEWKISEGKDLRKDAITRSMGVNFGKITEHLIPFSVHLEDFDPRDIRFIGSPVDLMIFDGATSKKPVIDIYFVEIKTGSGQLSKKQKTIRDAIEAPQPRIHWLPIVVPEFKWDVSDENE